MNVFKKVLFTLFVSSGPLTGIAQLEVCTNCGIGENNPDAKLEVKGCGNTDATKSLQVTNSDETPALVVTDGGKVGIGTTSPEVALHVVGDQKIEDGALVFNSGVAQNLASKYLHIHPTIYNTETGYVKIKTGIPFAHGNMMSAVKINYWAYKSNWELSIGWYTYTNANGVYFYSPNATSTGIFSPNMIYKKIVLSVEDGKVVINIPHSYVEVYGSMAVGIDNSMNQAAGDWSEWSNNWSIIENEPPTGSAQKEVELGFQDISKNMANKDLQLTADRTHNLASQKITFDNARTFIVKSNTSTDWVGQFTQNFADGAGLLVSHKTESAGEYSFHVRNGLNFENSAIAVKGDGKVGIGTNSPDHVLEINSDDAFTTFAINNENSAQNTETRLRLGTGSNTDPYDRYADLRFRKLTNELQFINQGEPDGIFTFVNRDATSLSVERMRIAADGKIGIGTANPGVLLDLTSSAAKNELRISSSESQVIRFTRGSIGTWAVGRKGNDNSFAITNHYLLDDHADFVINTSGNVGIGISSPTADLHIADDGRIRLEQSNAGNHQWDINQAGSEGLIIERVGDPDAMFQILHGGNVKIKTDAHMPLIFESAAAGDWQYMEFRSPNLRHAWMGIQSGTTDFVIGKENGGDIKLLGAYVGIGLNNPDERLEVSGRIKFGFESQEWLVSDGSIRIDIDNNKDQTDRAFIVSSDNGTNEIFSVQESGKVKIQDVLNLPVFTSLPINPQDGDVILFDTGSTIEMRVFYAAYNGWKTL